MQEIEVEQLSAAIERGARVVDVREPAEYAEGHVPGAHHIRMGRLADRIDELDRDARIHVVCASGNRSAAVVEMLTALGFDAVNVRGGTSAWARSGRPLARGSRAVET
ncbi:rhodanese-like domain-containing protein [Nocardioides sp. ChNu-153]|uniref:rhodanese-like domain-containing protein n=1 Tax=unclassified Nocardioides TaxID=2615069 RepID=UPI002405DA26|nr:MULTISPECIES: rhodanese-like domain-containing protein [unclassified Nocardioides]MDF9717829.1 rhodanese-like domain-containing protein [Nocardioides sp. ChNu-99]MDN7121187.1 rhodanese-like domain-containing protein [Nocardioides sp. ChNu-153]